MRQLLHMVLDRERLPQVMNWFVACFESICFDLSCVLKHNLTTPVTAGCSGVVATILAVDFWLSHRTTHRAPDFKPHALQVVYIKLAGAVLLFAASLAISIYFIATNQIDGICLKRRNSMPVLLASNKNPFKRS